VKEKGGDMKYIIACMMSLGIALLGMAQNYPPERASGLENKGKHDQEINSGFYDRETGNPAQNKVMDSTDKVFVQGSVPPDLKTESPTVDINEHLPMNPSSEGINEHLPMNSSKENQNNLEGAVRQTEFGKACLLKRHGSADLSNASPDKTFKMKDRNLKAERKANGVERIKFHNKNEYMVYHQKKNGKSHYKYLFKDENSFLRMERRKNEQGFVIYSFKDSDNNLPALIQQGAFGVERDVNSCMR
jgi:hypothetical protein